MDKKKVLLVDDSRLEYAMVQKLLADSEFELSAYCHSGADALALYEHVMPDIVLMDVIMPGMDGLETSRQILQKWSDARILIVSSMMYDDIIRLAKDIGIKGAAPKPLGKAELISSMQAALNEDSDEDEIINGTALYPISIDLLYDGMLVDFGIYYYNQGKPVLLCKNVVLTANKIRAIESIIDFGRNIYMEKENHDRILRETAYFKMTQKQIEQTVGYDIMKDMIKDFVDTAYSTGIVPHEAADKLTEDVCDKLSTLDDALILRCLNGIRTADEYLYLHCLNVGFLNGMLAKWCGMDAASCMQLVKAGLMHDLGKLKISPKILNKPTSLTELEYETIKRHPKFGYDILIASGEDDEVILDAVLHHHERLNGTGYPDHISGEDVSTAARICAISDIYDALVAERPYKSASTPFQILQELVDTSFSVFDRTIVTTLLQHMISELQGCKVLLSNGASAKIEFIDPRNPKYPIVSIDGEMIKTSDDISCIRIYD